MLLDPPLGSVPRQARGIAARARIYDEALAQFAAKGVTDTRIEDIVRAADVAWGTFFRYFPRKGDVLLDAAVRHLADHVVPGVEAAMADPQRVSHDIALELFLAMLTPVDHPPPLHGEMVREVVERRERFAALLGDREPFVTLVARVVEHGQGRGEVRGDIDAITLAAILTAGTLFTTLHVYYQPLRGLADLDTVPGPGPMVKRSFDVVWRGLEPL